MDGERMVTTAGPLSDVPLVALSVTGYAQGLYPRVHDQLGPGTPGPNSFSGAPDGAHAAPSVARIATRNGRSARSARPVRRAAVMPVPPLPLRSDGARSLMSRPADRAGSGSL